MARSIVGLFDSSADAHAALRELRDAGFSENDISFVASNARGEYGELERERGGIFDEEGDGLDVEEGATFGATSGALLGGVAGLLAGLGALAIPGIGPAIAGGAIASALAGTAVGAGAGAIAGGIIGALVGAGIPEEEAHVYAESLRQGGSVVIVHADSDTEVNRAADILNRHNVVDIDRRGQEYRESGWTRFDQEAAPYAGTSSTGRAAPEITGYAPDRGLTGTTPTSETTGRAGAMDDELNRGGKASAAGATPGVAGAAGSAGALGANEDDTQRMRAAGAGGEAGPAGTLESGGDWDIGRERHERPTDHGGRETRIAGGGTDALDAPDRPAMTGVSGAAGGEGHSGTAGAARIYPRETGPDQQDVERRDTF